MKKAILRVFVISACLLSMLFAFACADETDAPNEPNELPVTVMRVVKFFSDDGLTLIAQKQVEDGAEVSYDGSTPKKQADAQYNYVFSGWALSVRGDVVQKIIADKNLDLYAVFEPRAVEREKVDKPSACTVQFVYTGEAQQYAVAESDKYKVTGAVQTNAGEYTVTVALKNKTQNCWSDGSDADIKFPFVISQADNAWTEEPKIDDWHAGGDASVPTGAAKFGHIVWTYGASENGDFIDTVPSGKGVYYAKASVAATDNYKALEKTVTFNIVSDTFTITFAGEDGSVIARREIVKQSNVAWDGETPKKQADAQYGYTFVGWSGTKGGEAEDIIADADKTVYAVFDRFVKSYTIVFADADGDLQRVSAQYGTTPEYTGNALGGGEGNIISVFSCWKSGDNEYTGALPAVTGDATYTAVYESTFNEKYGSEQSPFVFTKKSELVFLSERVESGYATEGKYFKLGGDIDLTDCGFSAVGTAENMFKGNFNGDGHTLSVSEVCGVFAYNAGTIRGLTVSADASGAVAGGVAAFNSGYVTDCTVLGAVSATDVAGGVVGVNSGRVERSRGKAVVKLDGRYIMKSAVGDGGVIVGRSDGGTVVYANSVWDGAEVASGFASGDGSESAPYIIETAAQLAYFKDSIATNAYYADKHIKLGADIDLNGKPWSGIGGGSSNNGFKGVFDGAGHAVYNAALSYGSRKGFFNSASGTIKNLDLFARMEGTSAVQYVGLLVGINGAAVENCNVYGELKTAGTYAAIISGWSYGNITDSAAFGAVSGSNTVGGAIGYDVKQSGVIGNLDGVKNYATVTVSAEFAVANTSGVGGIVALVGSDAAISDCINYGDVLCSNAVSDGGTGGIVGNNFVSSVTDCANYGKVTANSAAGGIVGYGREGGSVANCFNYGEISGKFGVGGIAGYNRQSISGCVNAGTVKGETGSYFVGGISGMQGGGTSGSSIEDCENTGSVSGDGNGSGGVGGIVGSSYDKVAVRRCMNRAVIVGNAGYCGGLVGENRSGATVANCDNYGGNELFGSDKSAEELVYGNTNHAESGAENA